MEFLINECLEEHILLLFFVRIYFAMSFICIPFPTVSQKYFGTHIKLIWFMNPQCVLGIEYVLQVVCYQEIFVLYFGGKDEEDSN